MPIRSLPYRPTTTLAIALIALTSCGGEPSKTYEDEATLNVSATHSFTLADGVPGAQVTSLGNDGPPNLLALSKGENGDHFHLVTSDRYGVASIENSYDLNFSASRLFTFDLNDDALTDAVFLTPSSVYVRFANDESSFTPTSLQIGLANVKAMDLGYFDGNTTGDMALLSNEGLHILTANSSDGFSPEFVYTSTAKGVRAGDFNLDGITDLVLHDGHTLETLAGNGNGTFSLAYSSPTEMPATDDIHLGDINDDGWVDVLLVSPTGIGGGNLNVLVNNQDGSFSSVLHLRGGNELDVDMFYTDQAILFDANCDQKDDLAVLEFDSQRIKVLLSQGDSFEKAVFVTEPYTGSFPSTRLFGAPGRNDIFITATSRAEDKTTELKTYRNPDC